MNLEEGMRTVVAEFFFSGETYWRIVGSLIGKRLVLMGVQAFFCMWMMSMPISVVCGMAVQISLTLPWWSIAEGIAKGLFITVLTFLPSVVYLIAGTYAMKTSTGYFTEMIKDRHRSRSAAEKLKEGMRPALNMMAADGIMLACVPVEVFFFMNIAG